MLDRELTPDLRGASVESIETIITQIVDFFNTQSTADLIELIRQRLNDELVRNDFKEWLEKGKDDFTSELPWLQQLKSGNVTKEVLEQAASDCLQVMVLAYLPGTRYFQGAYIYSRLRNGNDLKQIKSAFRVPHLSGAVGWMTARVLNSKEPYVVIPDAQLDLRGRVAVPDLHLGNRSVLGFPVSLIAENKELASISGFVFFSHPIPGVFPQPQPSSNESGEENRLAEVFTNIRKVYESALASAIESYIFRRYGKSVLAAQLNSRDTRRVPLLALSDDDPTGFLVSILFESDNTGNLKAECEISESVLLETTAWLLRIASIYPDKWAPPFVQHMRQLGNLIEGSNIHNNVPMIWFSRGETSSVRQFYPPGSVPLNDIDDLLKRFDQTTPATVVATWSQEGPGDIRRSMADIMALFGAHAAASRQADLVVPIYDEQDGYTHLMGFFRINCDASAVRDATKVNTGFHNLWRILEQIQGLMNPGAARLFLAIEKELLKSLHVATEDSEGHAVRVQRIKFCTDTINILSDWLAKQMQRMLWSRINPEEMPIPLKELDQQDQQETLISFALATLLDNEQLVKEFGAWSEKCNDFLEDSASRHDELLPEVTFISFWPRLKLPVISDMIRKKRNGDAPPTDEFSTLLLADPGLLRMLAMIAPLLGDDETIDLGPNRNLNKNPVGWEAVHFGIPASSDITELKIKRPRADGLVLDVMWEKQGEPHSVRLCWDYQDAESQSRNLGGHAVANIPRVVARRLGENILTNLKLTVKPDKVSELQKLGANSGDVLDFVSSPEIDDLSKQLGHLKRAMLYDEAEAASWRLLPLPVSSYHLAFLSALYDERIKRPSVLSFRDFALANAKAFYSARLYDAQREAAEEHALSLAAIRHGYRGAVLQVKYAVDDATTSFYDNNDKKFISAQMDKVERMVKSVMQLAEDAIRYASRQSKKPSWKIQSWKEMCEDIQIVIQALDRPRIRKIDFDNGDTNDRIKIETSPELWRHLLSKLVDNGLAHGCKDPTDSTAFEVFLKAERSNTDPRRIALKISNFLSPNSISEGNPARVHQGLIEGRPSRNKESSDASHGIHGYGLIEAYNCCKLLGIDVEVNVDEQTSMLVISLWMTQK